ncbi:GNAT family N-acetyltransferase [uncultured Sulfitobacter sp.]|jgi:predicted acetyltransferase|uniref:GNAT family N-acetyltransferase n=1 Tax=uncultured Sulfitobacter sp. TaxID=191468 RepID=UPI0030F53CEB
MTLSIAPVSEQDRAVLDDLAKAYFAEIFPDGPNYYPSALNRYWIEKGRHPYVINLDGAPIGFALVWNHPDGTHELAEFTIHPDHRRQGVGTQAAYLVFNALGGDWTLGVVENSPGSMAFWEQCLAECENACEITTGPPKTPHQCGSFNFRVERQ